MGDWLMNVYRDSPTCVAHIAQTTGEPGFPCEGTIGPARLACEHEHLYDVQLCRTHIDSLSERPRLGCPLCRLAADDWRHRCRHGLLTSEAAS